MGIQLGYMRGEIAKGNVQLNHTETSKQVADGITEALSKNKYARLRDAAEDRR